MQTQDTPVFDLAIVGDGAAAALVAIHALHQAGAGQRIALIGPATPGLGIAYATTDPAHRLNVPAGRMSALPAQPGDFVDFLRSAGLADDRDGDLLAERFVPRAWYGRYLQQRLQQAIAASPGQLQWLAQRVVAIDGMAGARVLQLDDGRHLGAACVVLAVGNALRPLPMATQIPPLQQVQAWDVPALQAIDPAASVLVVGTGLSMVDALLSLQGNGHHGPVQLVSRHGLMPLGHAAHLSWPLDGPALLSMRLRARLRWLRAQAAAAQAAGLPWQVVLDAIRPLGWRLWASLSAADQARFLRHGVRLWDVHRHRIAPDLAMLIEDGLASGRWQLQAGGIASIAAATDGRLHVHLASGQAVIVDVVVNATGLQVRTAAMDDPLLRQLLDSGLAAVGAHGLGLAVACDNGGAARLLDGSGQAQPDLLLVGSLRMGAEWETIAIPELRVQAAASAAAALA